MSLPHKNFSYYTGSPSTKPSVSPSEPSSHSGQDIEHIDDSDSESETSSVIDDVTSYETASVRQAIGSVQQNLFLTRASIPLNRVSLNSDSSSDERTSFRSDTSSSAPSLQLPKLNGYDQTLNKADGSDDSDSSGPSCSYERPPKKRKKLRHEDNAETGDEGHRKKKKHHKKRKKEKRKEKEKEKAESGYSEISKKIMSKLGYKEGSGLGKHGQGITAPIAASTQKGRRGLGLTPATADLSLVRYVPQEENYIEEPTWLQGGLGVHKTADELSDWIGMDLKKLTIDDETKYCERNILLSILNSKNVFNTISSEYMRSARNRSNAFESLGKGQFMNRAALKMANLDAVFDFMFSNTKHEHSHSPVDDTELFYFSDVCAGPGGFSEYMLWRRKWLAKGFGFTLKGENDFRLSDFWAGFSESFETYYGEKGNGDVYDPANIRSFTKHVLSQTEGKGVHTMMADGGFSVEGNENIQEILSKRLYLCQFLVALNIVRPGGHFVCKLFDTFTPFSVGLIYLMYQCFKQISIHKQNTSRPANSERYIICKEKIADTQNVRDYLSDVNERLETLKDSKFDILHLVPSEILEDDVSFTTYITEKNNEIGRRQINSLAKILHYHENPDEDESELQAQLQVKCMNYWRVPIEARKKPAVIQPEVFCAKLLNNDTEFLKKLHPPLKTLKDANIVSIYDYYAVILGSKQDVTFYLCVNSRACYRLENGKWKSVTGLELSPNTLVLGEMVQELIGERLAQRRVNVFHIIDGFILGGVRIASLHFKDRLKKCTLFAKAITRPSMTTVLDVRVKDPFDLSNIKNELRKRMQQIIMKNSRSSYVTPVSGEQRNVYFQPTGLMLLDRTAPQYHRHISSSAGVPYNYCGDTKMSFFEHESKPETIGSFANMCRGSYLWWRPQEENGESMCSNLFVVDLISHVDRVVNETYRKISNASASSANHS